MQTVNIHDAKTHLSRLVEEAAAGQEIVIAKAGRPVARLVALEPRSDEPRKLGIARGRWQVPEDFDRMKAEEIKLMFEGGAAG